MASKYLLVEAVRHQIEKLSLKRKGALGIITCLVIASIPDLPIEVRTIASIGIVPTVIMATEEGSDNSFHI